MYRMGDGVSQDKAEAFRWYATAAKHGSAEAMFNVGASHYNGDGIGPNEFTAYAWFLLAKDAGDRAADDAVRRSSEHASPSEKAETYLQVAAMYEKGDQIPKDEEKSVRWLRTAADLTPYSKVVVAMHFLTGPDPSRYYGEALGLCRAAAKGDFPLGQYCVGYIYRKGYGVTQDSFEAVKWYQKAAFTVNVPAMMELAEMYSIGEGTKIDRPSAFVLYVRASMMRVNGARQKANELASQMTKDELKKAEGKLRDQRLDPKQVFAALKANGPS